MVEAADFKLTEDEQLEMLGVLKEMDRLNFYLFGSREMFNNLDLDDPTDWDFLGEIYVDWSRRGAPHTPRSAFIIDNFVSVNNKSKQNGYKDGPPPDNSFCELLRHKKFPNITIVIRKSVKVYQRMWEDLSFDFWHTNLWKSNPNSFYHLDPYQWKLGARKIFNTLLERAEIKILKEDLL